ncbi:hypothetical protein [Nitrosopumilus sp.]
MEKIELALYKGGPQLSFKGIALNPIEQELATKVNEIIEKLS